MKTNRRSFIKNAGVGAAGLGLASPLILSSCSETTKDGQVLFIGDDIAVANTTNGKVRGYLLQDIYHFLGVPFGANTSGANRFMPPVKPEPWTDIFPAIWYGNSAPQDLTNRWRNRETCFRHHWNFDDISENCLAIDVYTPGINDNRKRPVIVWLHGGWFDGGCSQEMDGYRGANFARLGDVVFCAPNHRLGAFGYSDFSAIGGEKYAQSGNVGMLDIVAALEWVRDNIEQFGGDPNNVTVIGQSGGGGKVSVLTTMPSAKGLFHKGVVLSAITAMIKMGEQDHCRKRADYILKEAGLTPSEVDKLQELPWRDYLSIAAKANLKLNTETGATGEKARFVPVVDGTIVTQHPWLNDASPVGNDVPMIFCSNFNEFRATTVKAANSKSRQTAPVYLNWFCWNPPLNDGKLGSYHTLDICFWFYNTDVMLSHTGGGARPRALSEKMAKSLIQFMKTGDPNGGGLPEWPPYTAENGKTMVMNDISEVKLESEIDAKKEPPVF